MEPEDELILLGRLGRPWGLRGELAFRPENSGGLPFHEKITRVLLGGEPFTVESWRTDGSGRLYLRLAGVETPEGAGVFAGRSVYVSPDELPVHGSPGENGAGVWYVYRLVGLAARYADGGEAGRIVGVEPGAGGAADVLVIETPGGGELLVPFVRAVVLAVDPDGGRVVIRRMEEEEVP
ncbi:MAG TPA: ribosome maturation factor RimM [bacterium]|nr:ribosome maturation factor RimM [bacterium]